MQKVKVSERAIIARINRRLTKQNEKLIICEETSPNFAELGRYYIVDLNQNTITGKWFDIERLGTELKVLKGYEEINY